MNSIRLFLIVSACLSALGILFNFHWLVNGEHPRKESHSVGKDSAALILRFAWLAWLIYLLSL